MLGSFRKRGCTCKKKRCTCGAKWHFRYDVIDLKTGKRKQKETRGFETKAEAEAESKKILADLQQGTFFEEKNITFEDFANQWIEIYENSGKVKTSTVDIRKAKLKHLLYFFGKIKLKDITKLMYQDMLLDLQKKYARKTIASVHETGSLLFKKAVELEIISRDITEHAEMPYVRKTVAELEEEQPVPKYLEKEELSQFLKAARNSEYPLDYPIFLCLSYTGMRVGELCSLKWRDINYIDQTISITKTIYNKKNNTREYLVHTPKTKSSIRVIDVDELVLKTLEDHRVRQNLLRMEKRNTYFDEGYVFANENAFPGYPLVPADLIKRMNRILKLAKINHKLSPHSLRHTHTSLLAEADVSLETIMNRLGHHDDKVTRTVYLHVTKPRKKEASQKFAKLMSGI
ncbi:site-specific integrase [Paenibacillus selenitireducens]|uniref:Site-specific integrase n=1 Tax=Paenibacillus selenitireducens TaxID=1324314 RepID=A0A1T2XA44_9BACL|nr:site-specific integrase [Paenibacillus selenitireducens]OPA76774.1 site-specific integrase [Paenibacillus selenitireducens]